LLGRGEGGGRTGKKGSDGELHDEFMWILLTTTFVNDKNTDRRRKQEKNQLER
jgi:hypothetical protein